MSIASVSRMGESAAWEDPDSLSDFLANQLLRGTLTIVLGAGASFGFGLPSWTKLVQNLAGAVGQKLPENLREEFAAEELLTSNFRGDRMKFAEAIRVELFKNFDRSLEALQRNRLLAAVGALTMASSRGSVSQVVNFNFDDVLELYLTYYGHDVVSIDMAPEWRVRADVRIHHPHGILPSDLAKPIRRPIVFTQRDYDEVVGNTKDSWRNVLLDALSSHTCIFIGLSGKDTNLTSIMHDVQKTHVATRSQQCFWGVRFAVEGEELERLWMTRGVFVRTMKTYDELPGILFDVCQRAARTRRSHIA